MCCGFWARGALHEETLGRLGASPGKKVPRALPPQSRGGREESWK